jgi:hypothetical protein
MNVNDRVQKVLGQQAMTILMLETNLEFIANELAKSQTRVKELEDKYEPKSLEPAAPPKPTEG